MSPRVTSLPVVSLVVPVFQVAPWLEALLRSVADQEMSEWEIIAVDDGSTDGSAEILGRFADQDSRLKVHRVRNGGLGRARNIGLDRARAPLVRFLDSDDRLPPGALGILVDALRDDSIDYSAGPSDQVQLDGRRSRYWAHRGALFDSGARAVTLEEEPLLALDYVAWNKTFRRDFLLRAGLRFPERTTAEDMVFAVKAAQAARRVALVPEIVYEHHRRDGSITSNLVRAAVLADWARQVEIAWDALAASPRARWEFARRFLRLEAWSRISRLTAADDRRAVKRAGSTIGRVWRESGPTSRNAVGPTRDLVYRVAARGNLVTLWRALRDSDLRLSDRPVPDRHHADEALKLYRLIADRRLLPDDDLRDSREASLFPFLDVVSLAAGSDAEELHRPD
jgi:CDP-glycerol glycerophosphotransferase